MAGHVRESAGVVPAVELLPSRLKRVAEVIHLGAGQVLRHLGDRVDGAFAVIRGEMRLVRRARNGKEVILQRSRSGFFAQASLTTPSYHCDLVAAQETEVLCIPVRAFREALASDAQFRNAWMSLLASEVRKARAQCERLSLNGAGDRIVHYIESEGVGGVLTLNETRKAWATELGLTHESLYRSLRKLQQEGVIETDGSRFRLV